VTITDAATLPLAHVLPLSASLSPEGVLQIGGCDVRALADQYGTPLYVYDVRTVRELAAGWVRAFADAYPDSEVLYASKAYLSRPFARLIADEGLSFDVVSVGEMEVLAAAGIDLKRTYLHGNNKTPDELRRAVELSVGRVVIDGFDEIALLESVAAEAGIEQPVLLRVSPGIDAHTHAKTTTGILDVKFGLPIETGAAERAVAAIVQAPHLDFRGLHIHLGSPIFELEPYRLGIQVMAEFIADVCIAKLGTAVPEFSPGGGFAVAYLGSQQPPEPAAYAEVIASTLQTEADSRGFPLPHISLEPGRSIAARSAVALYTVGNRKDVPDIRTFVSVNGGMADNIRPAMYGSPYEALAAERMLAPVEETVTIAGKYCESGDVLARDVEVPHLESGELLAIPAAGAYQLSMASNYNHAYRPAVVLVEDGEARLMQRRETPDDLMRLDVD
jgi:diaminopimelate decarboxylase